MSDLLTLMLANLRSADIYIPITSASGMIPTLSGTVVLDWNEEDELILEVEPDKANLHLKASRRKRNDTMYSGRPTSEISKESTIMG